MTLETGAIIGMIIGMIGVIALTAFAIWSKLDEDRGVASQDARINYSGDRGRQQYRPFLSGLRDLDASCVFRGSLADSKYIV